MWKSRWWSGSRDPRTRSPIDLSSRGCVGEADGAESDRPVASGKIDDLITPPTDRLAIASPTGRGFGWRPLQHPLRHLGLCPRRHLPLRGRSNEIGRLAWGPGVRGSRPAGRYSSAAKRRGRTPGSGGRETFGRSGRPRGTPGPGKSYSSSPSSGPPTSSSSSILREDLRTATSISAARSLLFFRNSRTLSRPWPMRWLL